MQNGLVAFIAESPEEFGLLPRCIAKHVQRLFCVRGDHHVIEQTDNATLILDVHARSGAPYPTDGSAGDHLDVTIGDQALYIALASARHRPPWGPVLDLQQTVIGVEIDK